MKWAKNPVRSFFSLVFTGSSGEVNNRFTASCGRHGHKKVRGKKFNEEATPKLGKKTSALFHFSFADNKEGQRSQLLLSGDRNSSITIKNF
jgi:hypothetical protein